MRDERPTLFRYSTPMGEEIRVAVAERRRDVCGEFICCLPKRCPLRHAHLSCTGRLDTLTGSLFLGVRDNFGCKGPCWWRPVPLRYCSEAHCLSVAGKSSVRGASTQRQALPLFHVSIENSRTLLLVLGEQQPTWGRMHALYSFLRLAHFDCRRHLENCRSVWYLSEKNSVPSMKPAPCCRLTSSLVRPGHNPPPHLCFARQPAHASSGAGASRERRQLSVRRER